MTDAATRARAAQIGAAVADAATMGFHWLYDQARIAELAGDAPEFRPPNASDFTQGYFAHGGKRAGEPSHYGAQMFAMSTALAGSEGYDAAAYAAAFRAWFDMGGRWTGYIDRPTRATVLAMTEAEAEEGDQTACGADDAQLPAISKLPPLVARHHADPGLMEMVESAVRVTNNRDDSAAWGLASARMIKAAIDGASAEEAVDAARDAAPAKILDQIAAAAAADQRGASTAEVAAAHGLHCQMEVAFPVLTHAILTAKDYQSAVRANILAAGDNCGRSIPIGAVLGAVFAGDEEKAAPSEWVCRLEAPSDFWAALG